MIVPLVAVKDVILVVFRVVVPETFALPETFKLGKVNKFPIVKLPIFAFPVTNEPDVISPVTVSSARIVTLL